MKRYLKHLILSLFIVILLVSITTARAAVRLVSFVAIPDNPNGKISVLWETAEELDMYGFKIQRSLNPLSGFVYLLDQDGNPLFFVAKAEPGAGATYSYDDTDVEVGIMYYYQLEMIEQGNISSFSGVKSAMLGNTPTPTLTPTPTITPTPTASTTGTPGSQTPSATRTPTPTRTKTRQPTVTITRTPTPYHVVTFTSPPRATLTPTETPTITPTPTVSPTVTTTLAPLPSLTLLFPVRTHTPTFTPSPTFTASPIPPSPTTTPKPSTHIPLRMSFLGGIILLLWITLAGFLFAYFRRMSS